LDRAAIAKFLTLAGHLKAMTDDVQKIETPSDFRKWIMEPDYEAFMREPTDLRLAFHAAASLFHLRDWVAHTRKIARANAKAIRGPL
jgi:hypothetical protein